MAGKPGGNKATGWPGRLDHQVEMVVHQAGGIALGVEAIDNPSQVLKKRLAIVILAHNLLARIAAAGDVIDRMRKLDAKRPGHEGSLADSMCDWPGRPDPIPRGEPERGKV